jgi:hypothetical protein
VTQGAKGDAMYLVQSGTPVVEVDGKAVMTMEVSIGAALWLVHCDTLRGLVY